MGLSLIEHSKHNQKPKRKQRQFLRLRCLAALILALISALGCIDCLGRPAEYG